MTSDQVLIEKMDKAERGEDVITNDAELDRLMEIGDERVYKLRTLPNPHRVGLLDQYVGWIGEAREINVP